MTVPEPERRRFEVGLSVADGSTNWQAAIALGEYCQDDPEAVWEFVERWSQSGDEDTRAAIATCVLEHLLEHHFDRIFPRCRKLVRSLDRRFAATFCLCDKFGQSEEPSNAARFDRLKHEAMRIAP